MALLPRTRRVAKEDVPDSPAWFDTFLGSSNSFNDAVYDALDGNITFAQNILSQEREIDFVTLPNYSASYWSTISFPIEIKSKVRGCELLQIYKKNNQQSPIGNAVFINWYQDNLTLVISFITGLADSTQYILRLRLT